MNRSKIFFLILLIPVFAFTMHKYYVSMCEIEYVKEKQSVQIILGLFIDDLEVSLNKIHNTELNLATNEEFKQIDSLYIQYLEKHFQLNINNLPKKYSFIGKEYNSEIVHFYLEISNISELNQFEVKNTCLFKDFEDQKNIVKLKVNKFHKTFYLDNKNPKGLLNF
ncbi:DUF6702 family protein [Lutibacter sp. TH_r2]|uniref:DUF6702 family protein n=1 Tax=Lutibacter sp. TH_r2 TaxID=3082083 RepID=UPI002953B504|nr:DUF6702 family protein [Lutibacter sp. TH_r2]MDV7188079.1 DUF6702 family protein [Lutibacter sp. TH_r2]